MPCSSSPGHVKWVQACLTPSQTSCHDPAWYLCCASLGHDHLSWLLELTLCWIFLLPSESGLAGDRSDSVSLVETIECDFLQCHK